MNTPDMADRIIMLAGVHNFRDYGGYLATNGARLRHGSLYRSAQHQEATADDLARIGAINLATVIDLRGASEREKYPCARPDGFEGAVLFADGETTTQLAAPHLDGRPYRSGEYRAELKRLFCWSLGRQQHSGN